MPEDNQESKPQESKKNDTTVQVTLITVFGSIITALITAVIAPTVIEYLKKTPTSNPVTSPSTTASPSQSSSVSTTPTTTPSISLTPSRVEETTIYLQISLDSQRDEAEALRTRLMNRGFSVSQIESKESTSRSSIVVRYFHMEDLDVAKRTQAIASQEATSRVELESLLTYPDKEPRGIIEIWYPLVK